MSILQHKINVCVQKGVEFIIRNGFDDFLDIILDIFVRVKYANNNRNKRQEFLKILYNIKNSKQEVFIEGNNSKRNFDLFIHEFLGVIKQDGQYMMKNKEFNILSLDELYNVFFGIKCIVDSKKPK